MKRNYMKPTMLVVEMRNKSCLLAASGIQSIGGNANMNYRGAGNGNEESAGFFSVVFGLYFRQRVTDLSALFRFRLLEDGSDDFQ